MKKQHLLFVLFLASFTVLLSFSSCKKKTITVTETITVVDTVILVDTVTVVEQIIDTIPDTATVFILVRHAETTGSGSNPALSAAGMVRADELSLTLSNVSLDAVYSTVYNRTQSTAQPTANAQSLPVTGYNPSSMNTFANTVLATHKAGTILVVGHSNTTPELLNALVGANTYATLPETEYDNLFIVTVFEKGRSNVLHLKY